MNRLLLLAATLLLCLTSCVSSGSPDLLKTEGALGRQIQRVVDRHDDYVLADEDIGDILFAEATSQSAELEVLAHLPTVSRSALRGALQPVAERHDAYVRQDPVLDELERETYLATTEVLMRLATQE